MDQSKIQEFRLANLEKNKNRLERRKAALALHLGSAFNTPPKLPLSELLNSKNTFQDLLVKYPNNVKFLEALQNINLAIDAEDYSKPDTADMEYYTQYMNHLQNFVWPTAEELAIQATENSQG